MDKLKSELLERLKTQIAEDPREFSIEWFAELSNPYRSLDYRIAWARKMLDEGAGEIIYL